jgi:aryl-alcohol dehydrogenase-like predicted oxidoreductase
MKLGVSGIEVPALFIGGMSFGEPDPEQHVWTTSQESTQAIIAKAFDLGLNAIDTANCYARGTSEEFIGRSIRNLGIPREQMIIASKVYFNEGHLSPAAIRREIEGSLRRLQTDYLDLYIMHRFDYSTPIEETMQALDQLVREGKVRALGASEMYGYQYHTMQTAAESNGWTKLSSLQCHYNLLYREDERELIPVARQYGALPTPYSPLASGHLARAAWDFDSSRQNRCGHTQQIRRGPPAGPADHRSRARGGRQIRREHGQHRAGMALGARRFRAHRGLLVARARGAGRRSARHSPQQGRYRLSRRALYRA